MARRGHSAWLPLVAVLLFAAAAATTEGCCSGKLPPGRSFQRCTSLPDGAGAVAALTTVLESYRPSLTNGSLKFDVPVPPAAEYVDGAYTIYATVALPMNSTVQNTVWQAGPGSTGAIRKHATSGQNMQSVQKLDFLAGETIGASNSTTP
uniref:AIR12 DOMON domain-containing protein n=1 Tax=Oryza brachyantha TaxID=4533 RepID=J3LKY2_ORYBR